MVKDYLDKFATLSVRNELKSGYKIFEISWYGEFKKLEDAMRVKRNFKNSELNAMVKDKRLTITLKIPDKSKNIIRNFNKITKHIQNIIEQNKGEYIGYDFGLTK